jgi:archaellum component FlaC
LEELDNFSEGESKSEAESKSDQEEHDSDQERLIQVNSQLSKTQLIKILDKTFFKLNVSSKKYRNLKIDYEHLSEKANSFEDLYNKSLNEVENLEKGCAICYKSHDEHEIALQEFCNKNIDKSKVASIWNW